MKSTVGMLAGGLILAGLLLAYVASSLHYPYYLLWDGDFVPVLDTLLIGDGQLPAHVHHPSLGVYLILSPISRIGHWAGWISIGSMSELFTALNPFPCVAELITCLRLVYPFLVLVLVIALWLAMTVIFRPGWLASLGILLFLGMQESLFFDASMIRSELVSVLCWSFALLVMAFAARAGTLRLKGTLLLLAGFLLGLAFLTKVQSVVFVVIAGVFYLFLETLREEKTDLTIPAAGKTLLTFISVVTLIFFLFLFFTAWKQPVPCARSMNDWDRYFWAGYYGVEFSQWRGAGLPVLLALIAITFTNILLLMIGKSRYWMYSLVAAAILLAAGFFLSFLCHFLLYSEPAQGFHYLLTNFKVAFFRDRRHFEPTTLNYNRLEWQAMVWHFRYLLGVHALLIGLLLSGKTLRFLNIQWKSIGLLITLSLLASINSSFLLRYTDNDMIWLQVLFATLTITCALLLFTRAHHPAPWRFLLVVPLMVLFAANSLHVGTINRRIDANFNFFGWKDDWLLRGIFGGHKHYDQFMKSFYATDAMKAEGLRQARDFRFNRRAANFFVQNQSLPLTHVGVVSTGFPLWRAQNEWKISAFSPDLQASLIIDSADLPVKKFAFYEKEDVRKVHIYPEKFRVPENDNALALLIRADMDSYIFVDKGDMEPVMAAINDYRWPIGVDSEKTIEVSNGGEKRILHGILLQNYAELPLNVLKHPFTFVLSRHYNWASSGASTP